tara:strand:+ start:495 stop:1400 length:906 start_codon:yes stop_codon:yes gene_type:complete
MPADYSYTGVENANAVFKEESINFSTFETIDFAFYDFVNEDMEIQTSTNKGWKKVPIIWASPERAFFSKEKKELYDLDGTLIYPIISIERTGISKNLNEKGKYWGGAPFDMSSMNGGRIVAKRRIVRDKTNNYGVVYNRKKFSGTSRTPSRQSYYPSNNKKIVVETWYIPQPVYVTVTYNVTLISNYQHQMNQMVQPFTSLGGHINSFVIKKDGHSYETFLDSNLVQTNNVSSYNEEERVYNTKVSFKVLGYLIGEGDNQRRPKIVKRENAVEVKIPRERVITGEIHNYEVDSANSPFYRD